MTEKEEKQVTTSLVEAFGEANQAIVESIVDAQQRNMKFAQSTFTNAFEVFKSHAGATRELMEQLEQLTQKQQEAFQKLMPGMGETRWMESYMSFLRKAFSSYQQALDAAEKTTQQGLERFEKATEDFEKAAQQPVRSSSKQSSH